MGLSNVDFFNNKECNKIDPQCINAYFEYDLDPDNPTNLKIDTPWGGKSLDLTSIVKAAETVTTLYIGPEDDPSCLIFEREDGQSDCIHGDDLSRIISMTKLKDVDQDTAPTPGDVYIYGVDGKFHTFNLGDYIENMNTTINNMNAAITGIQNKVNEMYNRWALPNGVPDDAKIMVGNINLYSDTNAVVNTSGVATTLDKSHGIYGHHLNVDKAQDELFG